MSLRTMLQAATLAAAALLLGGANENWTTVVAETDGGHRIGNPDAKLKLIEFISYTCPHCARFAREGEAPLKLAYVGTGQASLEIRHLIRDPIDLTAAMIANCGAADKFPQNHSALMLGQDKWIVPLAKMTPAQRQRWFTQSAAGRRAIATDFGFYALMAPRGYRRTDIDRCLADEAMAKKLADNSAKDWRRPGVGGTPAFAVNGAVLPGTHSWDALERQLKDLL